jgi:hypothetical protein
MPLSVPHRDRGPKQREQPRPCSVKVSSAPWLARCLLGCRCGRFVGVCYLFRINLPFRVIRNRYT